MARSTNGSSDLINCGDLSTLLGANNNLTAVGWFKVNSVDINDGGFHSLFSSGNGRGGGGSDAFNFTINATGVFSVQVNAPVDQVSSVNLTSGAGDANWHHWGLTYTPSGTVTTGYYDGINKGTSSTFQRGNPSVSTKIGCGNTPASANTEFVQLDGVAEAAIWVATLSDAEMALLGNGYSPSFVRPQSLLRYWPLLRENIEIRDGTAPTLTGTAVVAHPRVDYHRPAQPRSISIPAPTTQLQFVGFMGTSGV